MSQDSPAAILFNTDGYEVTVKHGIAIPANTSGILSSGSDGTNSRFISVDSSGRTIIVGAGTAGSPVGGVVTIQGIAGGTTIPVSGSITATNASIGTNNSAIPTSSTQIGGSDGTNLQAARIFDTDTGAGSQYVLGVNLRLSGSGGSTEFGTNANPIRIDTTGTTTQPISAVSLPLPTGAATEVTLGGVLTTSAFQARINTLGQKTMATSTPVVISSDQSAIPITGTVTAVNASVSTTGTTPPASATYSGASVTTNAPTYASGQMHGLSLTTGGRLRVESECLNVVDAGNSTTALLGAGGVFTGTSVDLLGYSSVTYSVFASHPSAVNGLVCQFSPDNVNWDDRIVNDKDADGTVSDLSVRCHDRYFRIKYTNGATPQTTFRLQTILKRNPPAGDTTGVDHAPRSGDDALLTKSVISGKTPGGNYVDVRVSNTGRLQIGGGVAPSDSYANPADAMETFSLIAGWNGTTWDRITVHGNNIDGDTVESSGSLATTAHGMFFNGTTWDRVRGTVANGMLVDVSRVIGNVAITAASLPLPTGAATETTLSTRLADTTFTTRINTLGQKTMSASTPVVIASDQSSIPVSQSTAANLNATVIGSGSAGSPATGVVTIQGIAGGTAIPVSGTITANNGSVGTNNSAIPTSSTQIGGSDGTNLQAARIFDVDTGAGSQYVLGVNLRLSGSGGSTEFGTNANPIRIDPTGTTTQPISAVSLPLPTGAATEATLSTRLADTTFTTRINTLGQKTMANSTPVVIASDQSNISVSQATASSLNAQVVGPGASGAAIVGNPVRIGASDGTNTRNIVSDTSGRLITVGAAAAGAAISGNPVLIGGSDGTNARAIRTDIRGISIQENIGWLIASGGITGYQGHIFGQITLNTLSVTSVLAGSYTEPATAAQRSISSSSANDTSAGTGARTILITYFDNSMSGPNTETITLNGTSSVNTVASNIRFIEKIEVLTAGSGGVNAGTITLFNSTGGGGGTLATIPIGINNTNFCHHYIPSTRSCYIKSMSVGLNAGGGQFACRAFLEVSQPTGSNIAVYQATTQLRTHANSTSGVIDFNQTPIVVAGARRILMRCLIDQASSSTVYGSFSYVEI